jgi:hypothetical protein
MPRTPFISARLKAQRAKRHISEFKAVFDYLASTDFCKVTPQPNDDSTAYFLRVEAAPLPADFSLIVGDCVHCLRASLDHLATQIVFEATGANKRIHFPMHETRDNLVDMVAKSPIKDAFPEGADIILNEINPCSSGNALLWQAGRLNNIDKHNQIVVVAGVTTVELERFSDENNNVFENCAVSLRNGTIFNPVSSQTPFKIEGKITPALEILFGPPVLEREQVLQTLIKMHDSTTNAINAIEPEYLR